MKIELQVIGHALSAVAEEMGAALVRAPAEEGACSRGGRAGTWTRIEAGGYGDPLDHGIARHQDRTVGDHLDAQVMPLGDMEPDRTDQFLPLTELRARLDRSLTLVP